MAKKSQRNGRYKSDRALPIKEENQKLKMKKNLEILFENTGEKLKNKWLTYGERI
jgi:hypothetical protein